MPLVLILGGLAAVVLLSRKSSAAKLGSTDLAGECGPYPPLVTMPDGHGWRPYCPARQPAQGPRVTSAAMGQKAVLYVQEGRRGMADLANTASVDTTVVGGDAKNGYSFRVDRVRNTFNMQSNVAAPAIGTVFVRVAPSFIDFFLPASTAGTTTTPANSGTSNGAGSSGGDRTLTPLREGSGGGAGGAWPYSRRSVPRSYAQVRAQQQAGFQRIG